MVILQWVVRKSLCLAAFMLLFGCGSSNEAIDIQSLIVGKKFKIASRSENGGTLELKTTGTFNSLIGGTQCNPNETDVVDGQYRFSADKKVITFSAFGFDYTGKVIDASATRVIIEFDLGPGFIVRDTFIPKT
jgi:hypothetical protein